MTETTGTVDFVVGDSTYQTWYKALGDLKSASGQRPLVLLHGGPGIPHHGLLGHAALYKLYGIPIIWYDQLGCGASTHLPDAPASFWTPELFMDELENLIAKLGIADDFDILGHSWGGMLAAQWAATRHPPGLQRVVLVCAPASMKLWEEAAAGLLKQMPDDVQGPIGKAEKEGNFEDPAYLAALRKFYAQTVCRCNPWPVQLRLGHAELKKDPTVYNIMLVRGPLQGIPQSHMFPGTDRTNSSSSDR